MVELGVGGWVGVFFFFCTLLVGGLGSVLLGYFRVMRYFDEMVERWGASLVFESGFLVSVFEVGFRGREFIMVYV